MPVLTYDKKTMQLHDSQSGWSLRSLGGGISGDKNLELSNDNFSPIFFTATDLTIFEKDSIKAQGFQFGWKITGVRHPKKGAGETLSKEEQVNLIKKFMDEYWTHRYDDAKGPTYFRFA